MNEMEQMLIGRCKNGDISAFEILISEHERKIYNIAFGIVGNTEDAKDIAQDALVKAFVHIKTFREESSFSTWIYRIVMNTGKDFLRKGKKNLSIEDTDYKAEIKDDRPGPLEKVEGMEKNKEIHEALMGLKEEYRNVVFLKDVQGFSYQEIAEILDINVGTVKSRISRGRYMLRDLLTQTKEL